MVEPGLPRSEGGGETFSPMPRGGGANLLGLAILKQIVTGGGGGSSAPLGSANELHYRVIWSEFS